MTRDEPPVAEQEERLLHTILVVEDDESIGEFMSDAIRQETPYHPLHVRNAVEALAAVQAVNPSLFLLDSLLPGTRGLELADRLHALPGLESVPTVMERKPVAAGSLAPAPHHVPGQAV